MRTLLIGAVIAQWRGWPGPGYETFGWPWPGLIWLGAVLLFWACLLAALVWAVRASATSKRGSDGALDVLRRRLASGEIAPEEYEHIRQILRD